MNCIICANPLNQSNDSAEHIIQNAIGGFRTVTGLLCTTCNNTTGRDWDAELASQLNGMCHFFAIKRDRGSVPAEVVDTTAGETFKLLTDGSFSLMRPSIERTQVGDQTQIQVTARDMREARKILTGLMKKHPEIDVEAELKKAEAKEHFPEGMIHLPVQIGGERSGRAIVKSAVAFAHACSISDAAYDRALNYLRNQGGDPPFGYYSSTDLVIERPPGVPFHCVAISGNPGTGLLIGYVEYFGFLRCVVLLSETYSGEKIDRSHAIDPTSGQELNLSVRLNFTLADMTDIFAYKHCDYANTREAANVVIGAGMGRKREREFQHISAVAARYAMENCGAQPGDELTEEQRAKLVPLMMEKIVPFIANLQKPRPGPHDKKAGLEGSKDGPAGGGQQ